MMTIELKLNERVIAKAKVLNKSNLADFSNYTFRAESQPSPITGREYSITEGQVLNHRRKQSAWALVSKVAAQIALSENYPKEELPKRDELEAFRVTLGL